VRVAVAVPHVRIADPHFNAERTIALARQADADHAALVLFPELGLSAYSNEDLFQQDALLETTHSALAQVIAASASLSALLLVGAPLRNEGRLFNCAIAISRGRVLGVTPKSYLPNYREFYEKRQFAAARDGWGDMITIAGTRAPFGTDLLYTCTDLPQFVVHSEICEDVWTPIPPSTYAALAGATVLCNLSASNITIGKADYRRALCAAQSARCIAAYLYSAAGPGESTTDLSWDGHALIYENGDCLTESQRFAADEHVIAADVDLERLQQDRMRLSSFSDSVGDHRAAAQRMRRITFSFEPPAGAIPLQREIARFPFVPNDPATRDARCYEAYNIQIHGLIQRLQSSGIKRVVIGVSGGLDSTQALIVAARTMDRMGLPRSNVLAYTMPGFATSSHTRSNAHALMQALGVHAAEIDIRPSARQMLHDIGHPYSAGEALYDVTFENVQAGERTSHLFRLANYHGGLVLGTGDLSELALGWATYGVGDHMSHYNVNASVPKTLIQHLIRYVIRSGELSAEANTVLQSILSTEISPELVPGDDRDSEPAQHTEAKIGPYELQDFNLYYITRYGFRPSKVAFLSHHAWSDRTRGDWPEGLAPDRRHAYDLETIRHWLELFLYRFFQISQFKRSAIPNGPKVGSGGSLSPRGDWRAPSDAAATVWLDELHRALPPAAPQQE
jgi:NAD+ synthase (glutamine-hydrolysing)